MKLIHTADLHLDSPCTTLPTKEEAKDRRSALLRTFVRIVEYAEKEGVSGILISGDLFDRKNISKTALNVVRDAVEQHPGITFFYLKGNHDAAGFPEEGRPVPANLKLFGDDWISYPFGETGTVLITGAELSSANPGLYETLFLPPDKLNIVMLHGQEVPTGHKKDAEVIRLRDLENRNIDYLALGHIHAPKKTELDARGVYVYPGCPEGRGFDECGVKGFYLLDIDEAEKTVDSYFVPFCERRLYEIPVDISDTDTTPEIVREAENALAREKVPDGSYVKFILTGEYDAEDEKDLNYLSSYFSGRFPVCRVKDASELRVDYRRYEGDISLKGEFVRLVHGLDLPEEDKAEIIRIGIRALHGDDLES